MLRQLILTSVFMLATNLVLGQRFSAEFRPGLNFPTTNLMEENLETGFGFEVKAGYNIMPHLKGFAGWGWNRFETESIPMEEPAELIERGFIFGMELTLPITEAPVTYFLGVSAVLEEFKLEIEEMGLSARSNFGLGWQLNAGVEIHLDEQWSLRPDLRYRSLSNDLNIDGTTTEVDLNYIALGVGIRRRF